MAVDCTFAFGVFSDRIATENAIQTLHAAGFRNADIFALFPDDIPTRKVTRHSRKRAMQGVAAGGGTAILLGVVLEWLAGAGMFTVGGLSALLSIGTGGGFIGAWAASRVPDYERRYEGRVRRGDILISVRCEDLHWAKKAREILKRAGGDDVSTSGAVTGRGVPARTTVRPYTERTVAPPLRLVTSKPTERPGPALPVPTEVDARAHRKSAAS